jgi:hypothetical protein
LAVRFVVALRAGDFLAVEAVFVVVRFAGEAAAVLGEAFLAVDFLVVDFFAADLVVGDFLAVALVAGDFLAVALVAGDFLAAALVTGDFLAVALVAGDFLAAALVTGDFLAVAFVVGDFLAVALVAGDFLAVALVAGDFLAVALVGVAFLTAFLAADVALLATLLPDVDFLEVDFFAGDFLAVALVVAATRVSVQMVRPGVGLPVAGTTERSSSLDSDNIGVRSEPNHSLAPRVAAASRHRLTGPHRDAPRRITSPARAIGPRARRLEADRSTQKVCSGPGKVPAATSAA